jgi:hypothetical protein
MLNDGSCKPYYSGRISVYLPTSLAGKIMAALSQNRDEENLAKDVHEILNNHKLCTLKT